MDDDVRTPEQRKAIFTAQTIVNLWHPGSNIHPDVLQLAQTFLDTVGMPSMEVAEV